MSERITARHLNARLRFLGKALGVPTTADDERPSYRDDAGAVRYKPGTLHLDHGYGGWDLVILADPDGRYTHRSLIGHYRQNARAMWAILEGMYQLTELIKEIRAAHTLCDCEPDCTGDRSCRQCGGNCNQIEEES